MNIRFSGIELSYSYKHVLKGVDLELAHGRIHALLGENGAGKSSLMKILTGFIPPSKGKIFLDEKEVHFRKPSDSLKKGIACVYQRPFLSDSISVKDNLVVGIRKTDRKDIEQSEGAEFLEGINLDAKAGNLSGDQRFFAAFAASLLRKPGGLILDEPTALLNQVQSEKLFAKLKELAGKGMNIIVISHKPEDLKFCDDVTRLADGKIVTDLQETILINSILVNQVSTDEVGNRIPGTELNSEKCAELRKKENCAIIPSDRTYLASNPDLTVTQLVCSTFTESRSPKARKLHAEEIIKRAEISIRPEEKVYNLSGGMLQRLILERELWNNPEVIYLEDPFQGLDSTSVSRLSERLETCKKSGSKVVYL